MSQQKRNFLPTPRPTSCFINWPTINTQNNKNMDKQIKSI